MKALIYKAVNILNGKIYIGFTTRTLKTRIKAHIHSVNSGSDYYFHNAIRKYGIDSFKFEAIYESEDAKHTLKVMEPLYIKEHDSHESLSGYNMSWGGDNVMLGRKHSKESKIKMSMNSAARRPEVKEKMRQAKLGTQHTEEHKAKIRAFRHSEETKLNMSKNHAFKNGRPGHGDVVREFYKNNPNKSNAGKTWKKDPITGKRVWVEMAKAS